MLAAVRAYLAEALTHITCRHHWHPLAPMPAVTCCRCERVRANPTRNRAACRREPALAA